MIRKKEISDFRIESVLSNIDAIKTYFDKKNAICNMSSIEVNTFLFKDQIHGKDINVSCTFLFMNEAQSKITIEVNTVEVESEYEIDDYANKVFADIFMLLLGGTTKYTVRIYGEYYNANSLDLTATINWKHKVDCTAKTRT